MERNVFIPSRGRYKDIDKLCNIWSNKGFGVHLVVEPDEYNKYLSATRTPVEVHALYQSNQGIAYSRKACINMAEMFGYKSIIMADDDIKPSTRRPDGMADILEACEHPKVLGMTARYSYHDLCLGTDIKGMDDIILLPTGTFRLVGLNVENVIDLGNYDTTLEYAEDCDLFLRGLQSGFPWMVHLGSFANSTGTRYQPGGMLDFVKSSELDMTAHKAHWHKTLHNRYPDITNAHTSKCAGKQNCIRISWKWAYDKYLPDWRKWSDLDGGDLQVYIDG